MRVEEVSAVPASTIEPTRLPLIWRSRIPLGTLTVVAGKPGLGKSTFAAMVAAELSRKRKNVIMSSQEDDAAAVIRPRLDVAEANLDYVHLIPMDHAPVIPRDLPALHVLIERTQAVAVILDPIAAHFFPERRVHDRPLLRQLVTLARQTKCAIIGIHHVTKSTAGGAIGAIGGPSSGLAGTARAVYMYGYDEADEDRRALACVKVNGIEEPSTLVLEHETVEYRRDRLYVEAGRLRIVKESNARARSTMSPGKRREARDSAALEWLTDLLLLGDDFKQPRRDIRDSARNAGFTWASIQRAAVTLKLEKKREGGWGEHGWWVWRLPDEHPARHPEVEAEPEPADA